MINEVEVLEKVGQKIESPDRWCQDTLAQNKDGYTVDWYSPSVERACVLGWTKRVVLDETGMNVDLCDTAGGHQVVNNVINLLEDAIPANESSDVGLYNDAIIHSHVVQWVNDAKQLARQ